jgi:hypothetical protein
MTVCSNGARQEVGQEVRPRLLVQRHLDLVAGEHVVAVLALEPLAAQVVERAVGAAVAVGEHDAVVARAQLGSERFHRGCDPLRPVVQRRGDREKVDRPVAPAGDRADVGRQRAAGDDGDAARFGRGARLSQGDHPGKASWSMNRSLKSARPDSST